MDALLVYPDDVRCVKIVDKMIVSCGDTTVRIWNRKDGKLFYKMQLPDLCNNFDLNSEQTLLSVAHDKGVSIWDFENQIQISKIELKKVTDVRFNEPGTSLIVGQEDGQVSKIDLY